HLLITAYVSAIRRPLCLPVTSDRVSRACDCHRGLPTGMVQSQVTLVAAGNTWVVAVTSSELQSSKGDRERVAPRGPLQNPEKCYLKQPIFEPCQLKDSCDNHKPLWICQLCLV